MISQLIVLSEDMDILPYLNKNGLYPSKLYFAASDFREELNFSSEDTVFMLIIHGFTRFSLTEINILIDDLSAAAQYGASLIIMSDVLIKSPVFKGNNIQFIHYEGDLFFGRYTNYVNNKPTWSAPDEGLVPEAPNGKNCSPENRVKFWEQFVEWTDPKPPMVTGDKPDFSGVYRTSDTKYMDRIIDVNLYNN